jgi:hypothetical protein
MHYRGGCFSPEPALDLKEKRNIFFFPWPGIKHISSVFEVVVYL